MAEKFTDSRKSGAPQPVWRAKFAQFSWASGESAADEKEIPFNGILKAHVAVVSDNTGNRTITVAIEDEDDYQLYSLSGIAENATTTTVLTRDTEVYIPTGSVVKVTPSGDPGSGGMTVDVTFYGI